jgi:hypothetical protein
MTRTISRRAAAVVVVAFATAAAAIGYVSGAAAQQSVTYPVLTGDQIGFQLTGPGTTTGVLVIRIEGKWVPAHVAKDVSGIKPLSR